MDKQVIIIYAATNGYLDSQKVADCGYFEKELYHFLDNRYPSLGPRILERGQLDDSLKSELKTVLDEFMATDTESGLALLRAEHAQRS